MHMIHSEDKPQHWTNWHSCTQIGLRPTDQSQNCEQVQHWTMGERMAGKGGLLKSRKKQVNEQDPKITPEIKNVKKHWCRTTTGRQEEEEQAAELWRLQKTLAKHKNNKEMGDNQRVITRQHKVLSNILQRGNSERNERSLDEKKRYTNRTDDSLQPINTARVQLLIASHQPKYITASLHCLDHCISISNNRKAY